MNNKVLYFNKNNELVKWNSGVSIEFNFWEKVFKLIDLPYTFIITENVKYLPLYGENIVVILKSDEFYSNVEYISKVKAVFRNYYNPKYNEYQNCFFLPLAFLGEGLTTANIPIKEREIDVFFAGQITYPSRRQFIEIVYNFKQFNNSLNIEIFSTNKFLSGINPQEYYRKLANSKIALCPYGASVETYRHIEALRVGCICITKPLPKAWYFQNSPYITVYNWKEINSTINSLLSSTQKLVDISNEGLLFWDNKLSPKSISKYIYSKLII